MRKAFTLCLVLLVFAGFNARAQSRTSGTIKGKLTDTSTRQNLKDATISLLDAGDSTLILYALTKADGSFIIENVPFGSHLLMATFQGYKEKYLTVTVSPSSADVSMGSLLMETAPAELAGVIVKTPPITIKGDTSEFNASQYKTKPNAMAEDLLKKMPGVEVAKDGTIKAQGQDVKRILVDGKRFFGDDPKMATRNLPTDMIDKIQVYDAQSDQSAFSGFDDGNRETTINIITKKDRRKGIFGKASAGGGADESKGRYSTNLNLSQFNGNRQLSVIGQANNTNNQNFSIQDILGTSGNTGGGGGRGGGNNRGGGGGGVNVQNLLGISQSGIARTIAGGLNYSDVLSKKTTVSGSYFYNNMNTLNNQDRFRETFSTLSSDSSQFRTSLTSNTNKNQNHRINFEVEHKFDSMNSLLIRPSFSAQNSDVDNNSRSVTTKGKSIQQNDVTTLNHSDNSGYNFNNSILYRHRFAKRGRSISLNFTHGLSNNETDRTTLSYNTYLRGSIQVSDTTDQITKINREGKSYGSNLSYTEPMGPKAQMELSYNYNYNENLSNQVTMRRNKISKVYDITDTILSNNFENTNFSHRVSANYRRQISKEWNYTLGMGVQHGELASDNKTRKTYLSQSFNNYFPTLSVQYSKGRTNNLRFNYRGNTRQPSVNQLQDVIDNSNPLNINTGNPRLKQEFSNNISLFYTRFNVLTFKNFVANINGSLTSNRIGNSYIINTDSVSKIIDNVVLIPGAQFSRPVNLNGAYNIRGFVNYGFPLKNPKSNINLSTNISYNRDVNLVNNTKSFTNNYVLGETIRFTMNIKERFDINFSSTSTYNWARYSQQSNSTSQPDGDYFTQVFSVEPTYVTKSGFIISSDFDYLINRGQTQGYNQSIPIWTANIAQQLFKKKQGELKLSVFDLLNRNKSISRNVEQNYIEDVRTNVLQRYVMLTFTYNLRKFGGQQQRNNLPPGVNPGMMRGAERMFRRDN